MLLNLILICGLIILTAATAICLYVDYRHAQKGKKSVFWVEKT